MQRANVSEASDGRDKVSDRGESHDVGVEAKA